MMKKIASLLLVILLAFSSTALADQGVSLFSKLYGVTVNSPGVYATLSSATGTLYTGPGTEYACLSFFEWNRTPVHCLSQAYDQYGATWVLVDFDALDLSWRGYVRATEFSASDRNFIASSLPYETSYDDLTPMMIAQFYFACDGRHGPGEDYPGMYPLEPSYAEGTLIMTSGNWALMELSEYTVETMGLHAKCRLWVELDKLFY